MVDTKQHFEVVKDLVIGVFENFGTEAEDDQISSYVADSLESEARPHRGYNTLVLDVETVYYSAIKKVRKFVDEAVDEHGRLTITAREGTPEEIGDAFESFGEALDHLR